MRSEAARAALVSVVLMSTGYCSAAEPFQCPATLDGATHRLAMITFYDGPPEEEASLVYDTLKKSAGKEIATWQIRPGRKTWVVCTYEGTKAVWKRALPSAIKTCSVAYDPQNKVAGLPSIESITCR